MQIRIELTLVSNSICFPSHLLSTLHLFADACSIIYMYIYLWILICIRFLFCSFLSFKFFLSLCKNCHPLNISIFTDWKVRKGWTMNVWEQREWCGWFHWLLNLSQIERAHICNVLEEWDYETAVKGEIMPHISEMWTRYISLKSTAPSPLFRRQTLCKFWILATFLF